MEWHSIDPVDEWEENRNDIIYTDYQGNRNPFIDHPEFADLIWVNVSSENDVEKLIIRKLYSYPNPFNPETTISFSISRKDAENAKIEIYNIKGQKVKQFSDIRNKTSVIWDGLDDNGKSVSSGQYVVKLQQNGKETATKIMLLK